MEAGHQPVIGFLQARVFCIRIDSIGDSESAIESINLGRGGWEMRHDVVVDDGDDDDDDDVDCCNTWQYYSVNATLYVLAYDHIVSL